MLQGNKLACASGRIYVSYAFCLLLPPGLANAQDCLDTSDFFSFSCSTPVCSDVIDIKNCLMTDSDNEICDRCDFHKFCCGIAVCVAKSEGSCGGGDDGELGQWLREEEWGAGELVASHIIFLGTVALLARVVQKIVQSAERCQFVPEYRREKCETVN